MAIKKFPTPVAKYAWPFAVSAGVTYFLIYKAANASQNSDEFINDPRHPRFAKGGKFIDLENKT